MTHTPSFRPAALVAVVVLVSMLGACAPGPGLTDRLTATGIWARTSPAVATAGAVYMEITNRTDADDALVDVTVDPAIAAAAELHETVAAVPSDGGMGMASPGEGMMEMREVDEIVLPAGETVALEPGGYHIMLLDLAEPLELGEEIELTLVFESVGEVVITAEIRETAP